VRLKDETCEPGKEFCVHIFFNHETGLPKLEHGYILRLHRLKVRAQSIIFLHLAFIGHNMNSCRPNTSSYNTKSKLFNVPTDKLNNFLSINTRKWHICRLQESYTTWLTAVSSWKVAKLIQVTEMQAGICELHHSNSEGKLRFWVTQIYCSGCSVLSFILRRDWSLRVCISNVSTWNACIGKVTVE